LLPVSEVQLAGGSRHLVGLSRDGARFELHPPLVLRSRDDAFDLEALSRSPAPLGRELVLLFQAGAAALGSWQNDECLHHKVLRKYVVRGKGRAQPTHLRTKGKSRYGSRLRLQNARSLLVELSEKLTDWDRECGGFDAVFYACGVRLWGDLLRCEPPPPFTAGDRRLVKIPWHVHEPRFEELERIRWRLTHGRLVFVDEEER
jgi:hypothetical protein